MWALDETSLLKAVASSTVGVMLVKLSKYWKSEPRSFEQSLIMQDELSDAVVIMTILTDLVMLISSLRCSFETTHAS